VIFCGGENVSDCFSKHEKNRKKLIKIQKSYYFSFLRPDLESTQNFTSEKYFLKFFRHPYMLMYGW
jgi:hypothetical protein